MDSIQKLTQISQDRFSDREFGKLFNRLVSEDIHQTDILLDGLLNYFQVTHPIKKTGTVNTLIEEAFKKHQVQLKEKGVKLSKKLEKDLPEIIVPDEHLKYILNSVLQYAIASAPSNGNIEFLTKFSMSKRGGGEERAWFEEHGGTIEIMIILEGDHEPMRGSVHELESIPPIQKDGALGLMLRLIKEMVMKNRGIMKFEVDEKKAKTMISFIFPLERRKVAFYEPKNITPPGQSFEHPGYLV